MVRIGISSATLALAALSATCLSAAAQNSTTITAEPPKLGKVSPNQDYFPLPGKLVPIEVRPMGQMNEADRSLEASSEAKIAQQAGFWGLELNAGKWSYEQVACPALPNHLFLRFTRDQGAGDVSIFTASIPRHGGEVRAIAIERRGYSLYTPASVNALTISTFNHIGAEENLGKTPDWLAVGLCYATLAGANPMIDFPDPPTEQPKATFPAWTSVVRVTVQGDSIVQFTDIAARPQPIQWTLTFDPQGKLVKAVHEANLALRVKEIHSEPDVPEGNVIHSKDAAPQEPVIESRDAVPGGPVNQSVDRSQSVGQGVSSGVSK